MYYRTAFGYKLAIGCLWLMLMAPHEVFGLCGDTTDKSMIEQAYDKYYPIVLDHDDLSREFHSQRMELEKRLATNPEQFKVEERPLIEERNLKERLLFEQAGVTKEEFVQWGKDCLMEHPKFIIEYLLKHPELVERQKQQWEKWNRLF